MTIETKEQFLERMMAEKKPCCPSCGKEMDVWEVPIMNFSDGLGWGTPYMFVCFNDQCPTYVAGWEHMKETYGHTASYRNVCYPFGNQFETMPVFSDQGGLGQVVTEETVVEQERIKEATKRGFSLLAEFYTTKSWYEVLTLLLDASEPAKVRLKAAEMVGDIGDLDALEPLRSYNFGNDLLNEAAAKATTKIHERHFTMECPFCAEVVKKRAKICKHCGKDLSA